MCWPTLMKTPPFFYRLKVWDIGQETVMLIRYLTKLEKGFRRSLMAFSFHILIICFQHGRSLFITDWNLFSQYKLGMINQGSLFFVISIYSSELLSANCRFWDNWCACKSWKESHLLKPVFYLQKMTNFVKTRTFYKKLPLFIKNSILHIYKKLKPLIWAFIKNSIFGNNRDPCWRSRSHACRAGDVRRIEGMQQASAGNQRYYFIKGKLEPTFSRLLTVRAAGADPPLMVSLTVKRPFFYDSPKALRLKE